MKLKSKLFDTIPHIEYAFGTQHTPIDEKIFPHWNTQRPHWNQVHGTQICEITSHSLECQETDGFFTLLPQTPIGVITADCVPLLLAHPKKNFIMAIHAGWRGTLAPIHFEIKNILKKLNILPSELYACIGPCIHPCCYEVSEELILEFSHKFSSILKPQEIEPQKRKLDLPKIHEKLLNQCGITSIEKIDLCTFCAVDFKNVPLFNSFRRDSSKSRQYSILSIKKN